jgi:hypothetical protein
MNRPTQLDIARTLGIDRTTVSKVLNDAPGVYAGMRLRARIFEAAKKLGYDSRRLRSKQKIQAEKRLVEIPAKVEILLWDGAVHAKGTATVVRLDASSAELADFKITPSSIPLKPCYVSLALSLGDAPLDLRTDINRLHMVRFPRVSVKFVEMTVEVERAIGDLVRQHSLA